MPEPFEKAKTKWLEAMEQRVRDPNKSPQKMAPWDEQAYFQTVLETQFSGAAGTVLQAAAANSMRVGMVFSVSGNLPVYISTKSNVSLLNGVTISSGNNPFVLTQQHHGNLCQVEWYVILQAASILTVIEIRLREFPS